MADFDSAFWDYYIGLITVISIAACAVLLKTMSSRRAAPDGQAATTGHVWDEDLVEHNNPLPRWWIWMFYASIVFSVAYLVFFPGLGSFKGTLGWTSTGEHREDVADAEKAAAPLFARFAGQDIAVLAADPDARAMGQKLFLNNCAQCHASDGAGSRGFPNLTDRDSLYGSDPAHIEASILSGRTGVMPAFGEALGAEGTKNVAHYVLAISGRPHNDLRAAFGKEVFKGTCVACHGADGKGNPALGAPNLTDGTWLHGSTEPAIIESIGRGRTSVMPAHKDLLGEARVRVLSAYVHSLGAGRLDK